MVEMFVSCDDTGMAHEGRKEWIFDSLEMPSVVLLQTLDFLISR